MKKLIIAFLLTSLFRVSFSQQIPAGTNTDYIQKSKKQHKAAIALVITGGALTTVGLIWFFSTANKEPLGLFTGAANKKRNETAADIVLVSGLCTMAASIPLFIASGWNSKKAASLSFRFEKISLPYKNSLANRQYPAFSFHLTL